MNEILATIRHDSAVLETNVEESKAKIVGDTDQAVYALNDGVDFTNKDLAAALRVSDWSQALRRVLVQYSPRGGQTADDCKATSNLIRSDVGWIFIGEIRWSTTSLVTDLRCQPKGAVEDERVSLRSVRLSINQDNPSIEHRVRGINADDSVQRREQHLPPRSCHEVPWKQRECQEQTHRPKHQRGLRVQKKCNAAMRLDVWGDLHKTSDTW